MHNGERHSGKQINSRLHIYRYPTVRVNNVLYSHILQSLSEITVRPAQLHIVARRRLPCKTETCHRDVECRRRSSVALREYQADRWARQLGWHQEFRWDCRLAPFRYNCPTDTLIIHLKKYILLIIKKYK